MNLAQIGAVVLVLAALVLPLVLIVYFSDPAAQQEAEEYDYR
jgi:hypothetical protein